MADERANSELVADLTLLNQLSLDEWMVVNSDKDPGPPVCQPPFCNTGGDINSGTLPENDIYFFHPDHLGSTSYITNIAGETVQFNSYLPFGETFVSQRRTTTISAYLFNGKEQDPETGLYYYGARYYNPRISNWLSVDPLVLETMQPYQYANNNPIRFADPTGMKGDDFVERKDGSIYWDENAKSQATTKAGETYRGTYYARQKEWNNKHAKGNGVEVYNVQGDKPTVTHHTANEFGQVQVTKLGQSNIENNNSPGSEDFYSYQNKDGSYSNMGRHGDDWMAPESAAAFVNTVESFSKEHSNLTITFNDGSAYNPVNNKPYYNLGHARNGGHSKGQAFDIRFLTVDGKNSNYIGSLSSQDINLNGSFVKALRGTGMFNTFFSDRGKIPGSGHASGHHNHLHGQK